MLGRPLTLGLKYRFRHLLDKQRDSVCAFNDILPHALRQRFVATKAPIHIADLAADSISNL
jgi:hypothetical protein